jgi:hypothetical protein
MLRSVVKPTQFLGLIYAGASRLILFRGEIWRTDGKSEDPRNGTGATGRIATVRFLWSTGPPIDGKKKAVASGAVTVDREVRISIVWLTYRAEAGCDRKAFIVAILRSTGEPRNVAPAEEKADSSRSSREEKDQVL